MSKFECLLLSLLLSFSFGSQLLAQDDAVTSESTEGSVDAGAEELIEGESAQEDTHGSVGPPLYL